jgi:hypothetical protein
MVACALATSALWRRALTPNVWQLRSVSFFGDVSSEMFYPLMPLFLTGVLGAPVAIVGAIEGGAEGVAAILETVSGHIADRSGHRVSLVFGGYLLSALAKGLQDVSGGVAALRGGQLQ